MTRITLSQLLNPPVPTRAPSTKELNRQRQAKEADARDAAEQAERCRKAQRSLYERCDDAARDPEELANLLFDIATAAGME